MWEREILFEGTQEDCVKEEIKFLNNLDMYSDLVYNNSKAGHIIFSDEVRKKMALRKLGKKRKPITEETRKKMSDAKKGKTYSLEARQKMSDAKKGKLPWNKGQLTPNEVKKKLSDAKKGIVWSAETIQKRSQANIGKKRTTVICPHCGKEGGRPAMLRWHFEKCKDII